MDQEKKKLKTPVEADDDVDRISELPNSLLCHVLSLLPTKESAATSIFSTRWKYLFAFVPDIDLEYTHKAIHEEGAPEPDKPFLDFIKLCNRMILLRQGTPIRKFKLSLWRISERFHMILESSISAALLCQIQEVELFVDHLKCSVRNFPPGIFTCETLVTLKLSWRRATFSRLTLPNSVSSPNLKVLHLDFMLSVDEYSIQRLIQGCPQLEELYLVFTCSGNRDIGRKNQKDVLDFSSPSVKKLMLDSRGGKDVTILVGSNNLESLDCRLCSYDDDGTERVIINAPNLIHLASLAPVARLNFVENLNSLVGAKITAEAQHIFALSGQDVIQHLHRVHNVKSICLGRWILEVLLRGSLHLLPTFKNLIHLELEFNKEDRFNSMFAWKALPFLFKNAPNLEVLGFDQVIWGKNDEGVESLLTTIFPICFIENLKEIKIKAFENQEYEFKLVEHLLQNGKALRKVAIGELLQPSVCSRIFSFKRCSEHCQIVFDQHVLNANDKC